MPQEMLDKEKAQVENPQMNPHQEEDNDKDQKEDPDDAGEGMEYEFDEQAE